MAVLPALDRLKSQLLTSGLQERNNALYQVINQLIDNVRQNVTDTAAQINGIIAGSGGGSGGGSVVSSTTVIGLPVAIDGVDGVDGMPGPPGPIGIQGPIGPPGVDGYSPDDWSMPFIGNSYIVPAAGSIGAYVQRIP